MGSVPPGLAFLPLFCFPGVVPGVGPVVVGVAPGFYGGGGAATAPSAKPTETMLPAGIPP